MNTLKRISLALVGISLLLAGCGGADEVATEPASREPLPVIAEGHIVPADSLALLFAVGGRVDEVLVEEGEQVRAGQVLVRLADREQAESALAGAQLALEQAQQDYDAFLRTADRATATAWPAYLDAQTARAVVERQWEALDLDSIQDRIDDAEAEVSDRQEDLDTARETAGRYANLDPDNSTRKQAEDDLEQAQEDYNDAVRRLEAVRRERDGVRAALDGAQAAEAEALRSYEATLDGPDAEQDALLSARLHSAETQVAAAENALANYELTAPFAGTVTDVNVEPGQMAGPATPAVMLADFSTWYVDTSDLTELEVVKVTVGQRVTVVADALPEVELSGTVESIGQSFTVQGGDILYAVHIRLDEGDPLLRWGMTVEVAFGPQE